ncbi:hypothetical protein C8Q78DRAFT_989114 [Trametes maxima]|nr:hypothetical protein C8Q78DRAFT_989114 [Trametes maxima]
MSFENALFLAEEVDGCLELTSHTSRANTRSSSPSLPFDSPENHQTAIQDAHTDNSPADIIQPRAPSLTQSPRLQETQESMFMGSQEIQNNYSSEAHFSGSTLASEGPAMTTLPQFPPSRDTIHPYAIERFHEEPLEALLAIAQIALAWSKHESESENVASGSLCISGLCEIQPTPKPKVNHEDEIEAREEEHSDVFAAEPGSVWSPPLEPHPSEFEAVVNEEIITAVESDAAPVSLHFGDMQAGPSQTSTLVLQAESGGYHGKKRRFEESDEVDFLEAHVAPAKASSNQEERNEVDTVPTPMYTQPPERSLSPGGNYASNGSKRPRLEIEQTPTPVSAPSPPSPAPLVPTPPSHSASPAPTPGPVCGLNHGLCTHPLPVDVAAQKLHLRTHNERNAASRFLCTWTGCSNSYAHKDSRNKHVMSVHWEVRFRCGVSGCRHEFVRQDEVTQHRHTAHPT